MDETTLLEHQIKTVNTVCDAFFGRLLPDVPKMMDDGERKAKRMSRADDLVSVAEFIGSAGPVECKLIINELVDRVSTLVGCATELEDASCALTREIESENKHEPI